MAGGPALHEGAASVLDADPGLAAALVAGGAGGLARARLLHVETGGAGDWPTPERDSLGPQTAWLVVLAGWLRHDAADVFGPGDAIDPWSDHGAWRACTCARLAVIGDALRAALEAAPEVARVGSHPRARPLHVEAAQDEAPEERLLGLLWRLAARWARPTAGGPTLPPELDAAAVAGILDVPREQADAWLAALRVRGALRRGQEGAFQLVPPAERGGGLHGRRDELRARLAEQSALARAISEDALMLGQELEATRAAWSRSLTRARRLSP